MIFQVHGVRTSIVSCEVEADSEEEAVEIAENSSVYVDVWDTEHVWNYAEPRGGSDGTQSYFYG